MEENFIIKNGWEKSGWINGDSTYIHKNWNLENDSFFIEMKTSGKFVKIIEQSSGDEEIKFDGILTHNEDLIYIMKLLEYNFIVH